MDLRDKAMFFHEDFIGIGAIGSVSPDIRRRVVLIKQFLAQPGVIICSNVRRLPFSDQI